MEGMEGQPIKMLGKPALHKEPGNIMNRDIVKAAVVANAMDLFTKSTVQAACLLKQWMVLLLRQMCGQLTISR